MFTSVSIVDGFVKIPFKGKKTFISNTRLSQEQFQQCVAFASHMAYENKHQSLAFGSGTHDRGNEEIFKNALQGKLAEVGFYNFYTAKGKVLPKPEFGMWERGIWEDCDMQVDDKKISIKSTKHYGNLLLLEKDRYSTQGLYLEPADGVEPIRHDLIYFMRVKGVESPNPKDYNNLDAIEVEVTGYIKHEAFLKVIEHNMLIKKGSHLGIPMIVDNYYICAGDLNRV